MIDPATIVAIVSLAVSVAASAASYTAEGVTNAKIKAKNRNDIFLLIWYNKTH